MNAVGEQDATLYRREAVDEATTRLNDDLKRVYELKDRFSQRQDVQTTQDAIHTLLAILQQKGSSKALLRTTFTTLVAILSNVQARSLSPDSVSCLYKLFIDASGIPTTQEELLLLRLKVFDLALAKSGQKPDKHVYEAAIARLADTCFFEVPSQTDGSSVRGNAAPPARMQVTNDLSRTMGYFGQETRHVAPRRPPGRKSSISSLSSRRSYRFLETSDSDASDTGHTRSSIRDFASKRLESLKILAALAKLDTRALHPYWTSFFGPLTKPSLLSLAHHDLSLSVRMQAIQTAHALLINSKGYLDLARESKTKPAFTSLSQTLADIAHDLHIQVIDLVRQCFILRAGDLLVPALQLASIVIANSPYGRLATLRLDVWVITVLDNISYTDDLVAMEALSEILKAVNVAQQASSTLSQSTMLLVKETLMGTLDSLRCNLQTQESDQQSCLWILVASMLHLLLPGPLSDEETKRAIFRLVEETFIESRPSVQMQQMECLSALSSIPGAQVPETLLRNLLSSMTRLEDSNVRGRVMALLVSLPNSVKVHAGELVPMLVSLASDGNKDTRISAIRSLSTLLQSSGIAKEPAWSIQSFSVLVRNAVTPGPVAVRAEAYWNIANVADSGSLDDSCEGYLSQVLTEAIKNILAGGASRDAEMIRTSSIRITGTLLSTMPSLNSDTLETAKSALATSLTSGSPKAQWNAASAMKKLILAKKTDAIIVDALLTSYSVSENTKVRNAIFSALTALPDDELAHWKGLLAKSEASSESENGTGTVCEI